MIAADRDVMGALVVGAIDQETVHADVAHFARCIAKALARLRSAFQRR